MEETFVEYIVKTKTSLSAIGIRIGCIFIVICCFLLTAVLGILGVTLGALAIYLTYMAFQMTSVEYEYSILNSEIFVDKIMGQRKRKKVAEFDMKNAEIMADADSEEILRRVNNEMKVLDYSSREAGKLKYAVIFNEANGITEMIFEPNEKMVEALHKIRPSIVRIANR